ncbi:MAG: hypothetical protein Q9218_007331 [Villophora microphyllina]
MEEVINTRVVTTVLDTTFNNADGAVTVTFKGKQRIRDELEDVPAEDNNFGLLPDGTRDHYLIPGASPMLHDDDHYYGGELSLLRFTLSYAAQRASMRMDEPSMTGWDSVKSLLEEKAMKYRFLTALEPYYAAKSRLPSLV